MKLLIIHLSASIQNTGNDENVMVITQLEYNLNFHHYVCRIQG